MPTVYRDKTCTEAIEKPEFGRHGFLKGDSGEAELVIYDKGGLERAPREDGSAFSTNPAGWVSPAEFKRRKLARARAWKKSHEGQRDYLIRHFPVLFRSQERYSYLDCYGGWSSP
ncbi:MAG TPA: hypothetical protein VFQ72_03355 [Candidatus Paceibacterota bacterium]|nr:hypothetical protein [Candidatus Paceibacterota bacterium]